jgi:hypothetical protein
MSTFRSEKGLLEEIYGKGHVEGKHVKFRNKAGENIEIAITSRAKTDDAGNFLYHKGIVHNISKALEDQRNLVLRNTAGGLCHYLNFITWFQSFQQLFQ